MGHSITALIVTGEPDRAAAAEWGVEPVPLGEGRWLVPITHYFTAYRQARLGETEALDVPASFPAVFPREGVVLRLAAALTANPFALVMTDYSGGTGDQWACVFADGRRVDGIERINAALRELGVERRGELDEFDTVGLGAHRHPPDGLDRYEALCDELGV
ncbi:hypothetical protein AB0H83_32920 [Dactylosporangium sp. NPDC050688]|uniref:hypothetical protein n=1 Tax=Dactylosporangium sp. NPDC050688 TaxID=3157217 RepID=UPI0033E7C89E